VKFFDTEQTNKFSSIDVNKINLLQVDDYVPYGQVALLDALGDTISCFMEKKLLDPEAYYTCIIYVVSENVDNSSQNYDNETIKLMIKNAENEHKIKVLYLGANQNTNFEADKLDINFKRVLNYNPTRENTIIAHKSLGNTINRFIAGSTIKFTDAERQDSILEPSVNSLQPVQHSNTSDLHEPLLHTIVP